MCKQLDGQAVDMRGEAVPSEVAGELRCKCSSDGAETPRRRASLDAVVGDDVEVRLGARLKLARDDLAAGCDVVACSGLCCTTDSLLVIMASSGEPG